MPETDPRAASCWATVRRRDPGAWKPRPTPAHGPSIRSSPDGGHHSKGAGAQEREWSPGEPAYPCPLAGVQPWGPEAWLSSGRDPRLPPFLYPGRRPPASLPSPAPPPERLLARCSGRDPSSSGLPSKARDRGTAPAPPQACQLQGSPRAVRWASAPQPGLPTKDTGGGGGAPAVMPL